MKTKRVFAYGLILLAMGVAWFVIFPKLARDRVAARRAAAQAQAQAQVQGGLLPYRSYFENDLRLWASDFKNFELANFSMADTVRFANIEPRDFSGYDSFLSVYKPILTYSPDSIQFIDIYSGQLGLVKKGDHYEASPDDGQPIFLCNSKSHYWQRIYYGAPGGWTDEVVWVSGTKFILAGIEKSGKDDTIRMPVVLLGDTRSQTMERYTVRNDSCFQLGSGYESPKLKRMNIVGD